MHSLQQGQANMFTTRINDNLDSVDSSCVYSAQVAMYTIRLVTIKRLLSFPHFHRTASVCSYMMINRYTSSWSWGLLGLFCKMTGVWQMLPYPQVQPSAASWRYHSTPEHTLSYMWQHISWKWLKDIYYHEIVLGQKYKADIFTNTKESITKTENI